MTGRTNRQIALARRPLGDIAADDFRHRAVPVRDLQPGEFLVQNRWLSIDPYMRVRMNEARSYAPPQPLDQVMGGTTAGDVIASNHPCFAEGDRVVGLGGWQLYAIDSGAGFVRVETSAVPLQAYLGVAGMPGMTAWYGIRHIIRPKSGETIVVSAASGAVGSVAGQLSKQAGCRVIGIAGGPEKCRHVVDDLGLDACIDHKAGNLDIQLAAAAADGIDGYFDNVGGAVLDAVMRRLNTFARVAVCGQISGGYDTTPLPLADTSMLLTARLVMQGFIISDHRDLWPAARAELVRLVAERRLVYRETIAEGLDAAPTALINVLKGANLGKQLVRLS
ncbi:NADP-dependent oxidoreductase [Bradyrhizobium murdochi]|uniref:NADP-dependent oxidoreductase n=1 Tax=Bradyrhizobium murdochi TaxID=1038859 RepID=UPI00041BE848|nr:NADP-dependent oxidoreductase [Bradyrhizobium murdochi]